MSDHAHIRLEIGKAVDDAPVDVGDILESHKLNTKQTWSQSDWAVAFRGFTLDGKMIQIIPMVTDEVRMAGAVRSTLDKYQAVRYAFTVRVWTPDGGAAWKERLLIGAADREGNRAIAAFRILPNGLSDAEDYPSRVWAAHLFEIPSEQVPSAGEPSERPSGTRTAERA